MLGSHIMADADALGLKAQRFISKLFNDSVCFPRIYNIHAAKSVVHVADTFTGLLTKLADVIIGVGLWHGRDSDEWAAVPPKCFTEDVLSQIDLRGPQILQFWQVHLFNNYTCNVTLFI